MANRCLHVPHVPAYFAGIRPRLGPDGNEVVVTASCSIYVRPRHRVEVLGSLCRDDTVGRQGVTRPPSRQLVELVERGSDTGPSASQRVKDLGDLTLPAGEFGGGFQELVDLTLGDAPTGIGAAEAFDLFDGHGHTPSFARRHVFVKGRQAARISSDDQADSTLITALVTEMLADPGGLVTRGWLALRPADIEIETEIVALSTFWPVGRWSWSGSAA